MPVPQSSRRRGFAKDSPAWDSVEFTLEAVLLCSFVVFKPPYLGKTTVVAQDTTEKQDFKTNREVRK